MMEVVREDTEPRCKKDPSWIGMTKCETTGYEIAFRLGWIRKGEHK